VGGFSPLYFDFATFNFHVPKNGLSSANNTLEANRDIARTGTNASIRFIVPALRVFRAAYFGLPVGASYAAPASIATTLNQAGEPEITVNVL
jgi:hypothetical protein